MSWTNLSMTAALTTAVLVLLPVGSAAPLVITGGMQECAAGGPAFGSCNLVFRDEHDLAGLSPVQLIGTVNESCTGFPNGPYKRSGSPIDYVTLELSASSSGDTLTAGEINGQIGTDLAGGVSVAVTVSAPETSGAWGACPAAGVSSGVVSVTTTSWSGIPRASIPLRSRAGEIRSAESVDSMGISSHPLHNHSLPTTNGSGARAPAAGD